MPRSPRPGKLSDRRRRLYYAARKIRWALLALTVAGLLIAADRFGLFGPAPRADFEKYNGKTFRTLYVFDGDTIEIDASDEFTGRPHARVRLWGVDTPETVKPNTPPQHFGREASDFTTAACLGKSVRLELDEAVTRDKYQRLLAYVYLPDGRMLNRLLVAEGYGYADPRYDHARKKEFRALQRQARQARLGLWKDVGRDDLPYYYQNLKLPVRCETRETPNGPATRPEEAVRQAARSGARRTAR